MLIPRKTFLGAVGGTVATVVGFLYPGLARAVASPTTGSRTAPGGTSAATPAGADPTYASGEVVARTSEGLVLRSAAGTRAVRLPSATVVWKEFDVTPDAIHLHDWVDAKGTPLADGSLLARSGWVFVNIGRREGVVESVSPAGLTIRHNKGTETIELSPKLEVISATDGRPLPSGLAALTPGTQIGAVGLRLSGGGFRATRIWK